MHLLVKRNFDETKIDGMYIKMSVIRVFYNSKLVDYSINQLKKLYKNANSTARHGNNYQEHNNAVTNVHSRR